MAIDNLHEIIAYILKEIDRNGNPDGAVEKFDISSKEYGEILVVAEDDKYLRSTKIDYAGHPLPEESIITDKGYRLIRKYY